MWPGLATRRYVPSMFLHHFGGELRVSHWLSVLGSPSSSSGLMLDGVWRLTLTLSHLQCQRLARSRGWVLSTPPGQPWRPGRPSPAHWAPWWPGSPSLASSSCNDQVIPTENSPPVFPSTGSGCFAGRSYEYWADKSNFGKSEKRKIITRQLPCQHYYY